MSDVPPDQQDDSSIQKPVSSLKSHFENLGTATPSQAKRPQTTPLVASSKPYHGPVTQRDIQPSKLPSGVAEDGKPKEVDQLRKEPPRPLTPSTQSRSHDNEQQSLKLQGYGSASGLPPLISVASPTSPSLQHLGGTPTLEKSAQHGQPSLLNAKTVPSSIAIPDIVTSSSSPEPKDGVNDRQQQMSYSDERRSKSPHRPPLVNRATKMRAQSSTNIFTEGTHPIGQAQKSSASSTTASTEELSAAEEPPPVPLLSRPHTFSTNGSLPKDEDRSNAQDQSQFEKKQPPPPPAARRSANKLQQPATTKIESDPSETRPQLPPRRTIDNAVMRVDVDQESAAPKLPARPSALSQGFSSTKASRLAPSHHSLQAQLPSQPLQIRNRSPSPNILPQPRTEPRKSQEIESDYSQGDSTATSTKLEYPDISQSNRLPPYYTDGTRVIPTGTDARIFDVSGEYVCAAGLTTRVWSLVTGKMILSATHGENVRITACAFKPCRNIEEDGLRLWLGTNWGEIFEMDIPTKKIIATNREVHNRREIIKIYRHYGGIWTLDQEGYLNVWPPDGLGSPNIDNSIPNLRLPKGHTASMEVQGELWLAMGKEIKVYRPSDDPLKDLQQITLQSIAPNDIGSATGCTVIPNQASKILFAHNDGKVSIYSTASYTCIDVIVVNLYKINCIVGVGNYLWAGFNTGDIHVYDTSKTPWMMKKNWKAHKNPMVGIVADRSSIWKLDRQQVVSLGMDNSVNIWDGMLMDDWAREYMRSCETDYCSFRHVTATILTWNAGASKPMDLRYEEQDTNFFRDLLQKQEPPDILVFGLQELVDLEDKKLTAKTFFKSKHRDEYGQENLSTAYRSWRDYFKTCLDSYMPVTESYHLLHTASLVGLFTCIFVKNSQRNSIRDVQAAEVKTGMGGLHGNKGALIVRFTMDDSSLCFVNCHLAAGQTQTQSRNNDVAMILENSHLPSERPGSMQSDLFIGGGDGSMVLDYELCVLNGDLNYRIDSMRQETVIGALRSREINKLLKHDQLLSSRRKNPGFRLRAFQEGVIDFHPTYKYDVGTDNYDTSEKQRAPAWCDRILYRGQGKIQQLSYQRHEVRVSDHRPVSSRLKLAIKKVDAEKKSLRKRQCQQSFMEMKQTVSHEAKLDYLTRVFGLSQKEAIELLNE